MNSTAYSYAASSATVVELPRSAVSEDRAAYDAQPERKQYRVSRSIEVERTIIGTLGSSPFTLYALLDGYCDERGISYPSQERLAGMMRLTVRQIERLLDKLEAGKWIEKQDRKNEFGFVVGKQYYLRHHTTPSDKRGDITSDITSDIGDDITSDTNVVQGNTKVTPKVKENPPTPLPEHGPAQQIVKVWCEEVGLERPTDYRRAVGQAQHLVKAGLAPDDARDLIRWIRQQEWVTTSLDLGLMYKLADKWRTDPKRVPAPSTQTLTQADLAQKQYADWWPGTFQNLADFRARRAAGTLPQKGLLR